MAASLVFGPRADDRSLPDPLSGIGLRFYIHMDMDPYGLSRVVAESGVLPQGAQRLDPSLPVRASELLIEVESLNVDAASFRQIKEQAGGNAQEIGRIISEIVRARGKLHNPITGSGGMLIGRLREIGPDHPAAARLKPNDRIAT